MSDQPVLEVAALHKTFRIGFFRKRVEAVRGIDFSVRRGEIFGLLGPNGAGKTTCLKLILRLIFPSSGTIRIFGKSGANREAMVRLGYLPENPYVYQYLRSLEFLDLCGRLTGMERKLRSDRAEELVAAVGLAHAKDRPIGKFSKGMMQRIGLAQALLHDPEVLVLDEPMSGLDPIGRKEIRDLLLAQRRAGKTLLFTSHILSDVEMLCDRVAIMHQGKISHYGTLAELLRPEVRRVEVELASVSDALQEKLEAMTASVHAVEQHLAFTVEGDGGVPEVLQAAMDGGAQIIAVTPHRETLEDLVVREAEATRKEATP
jgi:ABC-2 type transport system ATP-binding protein